MLDRVETTDGRIEGSALEGVVQAKPLVPWIGGKRRLVPLILPWFEAHTCYVEPFAGAAALFFNKQPSKVEVLNDVNAELVNLYRVVQHHLDEFVRVAQLYADESDAARDALPDASDSVTGSEN